MALFGAPIAHEDGPRRAVHAALGIQRALRATPRARGARGSGLQMRIGLNTGPSSSGKIGDDLRMDYTAVGDTTNVAARLQQIARPGSVLVSEATHKRSQASSRRSTWGAAGQRARAPVHAFEVLRARGRRARLDVAVERGLTPLVGRDREVGDCSSDLFRKSSAGAGQVVFVAGEAGIGKSRLLLEFRRRLAAAGEHATWLEGRCISFGQSMPFLPLIDQLRANFGIEEFDGEPEIIAKVEHGMRRMGGLEAHIPFIRYLLSVDPGDRSGLRHGAARAPEAELRRAPRLSRARSATPPAGLRVRGPALGRHQHRGVPRRFFDAVATSPHTCSSPPTASATRRPSAPAASTPRSTLRTLSEADALAMAGQVLGGGDRLPEELREALLEKAEGVPFFVEEVTKTLLDLGILRREGERLPARQGSVGSERSATRSRASSWRASTTSERKASARCSSPP